jgi:hypothetical protein
VAPTNLMYISFGGGMRLVGEDYIIRELAALGLTRRGFRQLCRQLNVPLIHARGDRVLVDLIAFMLAMRTITRPGAPDFSLPGSQHRPGTRNSLPPQEIIDNLDETVSMLEQGRKMFGIVKPGTLRSAAGEVVARLKDTQAKVRP